MFWFNGPSWSFILKTLKENKEKTIICIIRYWGLTNIQTWMTDIKMLSLAAILPSSSSSSCSWRPVPWSSRWSWSHHLFLGRPMFLRPFGLYCSACFGSQKKVLNIRFVFWYALQLLYEKFFILRRMELDVFIDVYWSLCKILVILIRF